MRAMMILCQKLYQKKTQKQTWILRVSGAKATLLWGQCVQAQVEKNCNLFGPEWKKMEGNDIIFGQRYFHIKEHFSYRDILIILC